MIKWLCDVCGCMMSKGDKIEISTDSIAFAKMDFCKNCFENLRGWITKEIADKNPNP